MISGPESTRLAASSCTRGSIVALQVEGVKGGGVSVAGKQITVGGQSKLEDISIAAQLKRVLSSFLVPL